MQLYQNDDKNLLSYSTPKKLKFKTANLQIQNLRSLLRKALLYNGEMREESVELQLKIFKILTSFTNENSTFFGGKSFNLTADNLILFGSEILLRDFLVSKEGNCEEDQMDFCDEDEHGARTNMMLQFFKNVLECESVKLSEKTIIDIALWRIYFNELDDAFELLEKEASLPPYSESSVLLGYLGLVSFLIFLKEVENNFKSFEEFSWKKVDFNDYQHFESYEKSLTYLENSINIKFNDQFILLYSSISILTNRTEKVGEILTEYQESEGKLDPNALRYSLWFSLRLNNGLKELRILVENKNLKNFGFIEEKFKNGKNFPYWLKFAKNLLSMDPIADDCFLLCVLYFECIDESVTVLEYLLERIDHPYFQNNEEKNKYINVNTEIDLSEEGLAAYLNLKLTENFIWEKICFHLKKIRTSNKCRSDIFLWENRGRWWKKMHFQTISEPIVKITSEYEELIVLKAIAATFIYTPESYLKLKFFSSKFENSTDFTIKKKMKFAFIKDCLNRNETAIIKYFGYNEINENTTIANEQVLNCYSFDFNENSLAKIKLYLALDFKYEFGWDIFLGLV
ncbi:hypothetical protein HK099_002707 [Clydaea vesicula]|uniref:Uncharacterized protein n=1 Tax=Clydaea vesicula TaxID=447962 RepID=A0AAD5XZ58_9FUNG|nr:hypothetical protein HK099_002707 [Clydaea vesicula]